MQVVRATDSRAAGWGPANRRTDEAAALQRLGAVREFGRVVTRSGVMHETIDMLERFAKTDITVTLLGETGVGKDVLAHAMHERSARARGPFVVFDCAAVAANLAESELLGHERGAFTGALAAHAGAFERAHGGTLFLDEIAELPLDLQPRLLRGLESRRVRRVGGRVDRRVDVRVIAATNRDLKSEVIAGRFRGDLYFRLGVAVVQVPSLRRRLEDLPQLVQDLLLDLGHPNMRVSEPTFAVLRAHGWTGNIRELKNALSCAAAFVEPGTHIIESHHLKLIRAAERDRSWLEGLPLAGHALDLIERAAIRQTLEQMRGNRKLAAQVLGIAVSTLYEKVKKYGL